MEERLLLNEGKERQNTRASNYSRGGLKGLVYWVINWVGEGLLLGGKDLGLSYSIRKLLISTAINWRIHF